MRWCGQAQGSPSKTGRFLPGNRVRCPSVRTWRIRPSTAPGPAACRSCETIATFGLGGAWPFDTRQVDSLGADSPHLEYHASRRTLLHPGPMSLVASPTATRGVWGFEATLSRGRGEGLHTDGPVKALVCGIYAALTSSRGCGCWLDGARRSRIASSSQ